MTFVAIAVGVILVVSVLADVFNTLVTTRTSLGRWWLTRNLYVITWRTTAAIGRRIPSDHARERLYSIFAPISVLAMLANIAYDAGLELQRDWNVTP